jgi:hypothetical protein
MTATDQNEPKLKPIEFIVELELGGPFLTGSSEAGPWGVDAVCARDALGRLYIAGSLARGKFREALDAIGTHDRPDGTGTLNRRCDDMDTSDKRDEQRRKPISDSGEPIEPPPRFPYLFFDFIAGEGFPGPGRQTITRVAMDDETGAARLGALRVIDCPALPGSRIVFRGAVRCVAKDSDSHIQLIIKTLARGLGWVTGFGAEQTTGMGRLQQARVVGYHDLYDWGAKLIQPSWLRRGATRESDTIDWSPAVVTPTSGASSDALPESVVVDYEVADAFCVASGLVKGNIFESDDHLRGDVIKGALAESLRQLNGLPPDFNLENAEPHHDFDAICRNFSKIRVTTARACRPSDTGLPAVPPHSLAVSHDRVYDFALVDDWDKPEYAPLIRGTAAKFLHDWKPEDADLVSEHFPKPALLRELRVRTAIDSKIRRAKEKQLFAYRLIRPEGFVWRGTISFSALEQSTRTEVWKQLAWFLSFGWLHIGKTKARTRGVIRQPLSQKATTESDDWFSKNGIFVISLRSPALLLDPARLVNEVGIPVSGEEVDRLYEEVWSELSGGSLVLKRRFVTHELVGGHQSLRFRRFLDDSERNRKNQRKQPYNPALWTEPGSVFVLQHKTDNAIRTIDLWLRDGLPLPDWAVQAYGNMFETNPYLPSNGFGEIDVNLPCHVNLRPSAAELGLGQQDHCP